MNNLKNIKAVIFDLDNTLIDRQRAFKEAMFIIVSETLPNISDELVAEALHDILKWDDNGTQPRLEVFEKYCNKYNVKKSKAIEIDEYWRNSSGSIVYLFPDALDVIDYLKSKYRLAILTNGMPLPQRKKLNSSGILKDFEFSVVSGEVGIDKPDERIFKHVVDKLNLSADECIYVGDNYEVDIMGSSKIGILPVFVNRSNKKDVQGIVIEHLCELKDFL